MQKVCCIETYANIVIKKIWGKYNFIYYFYYNSLIFQVKFDFFIMWNLTKMSFSYQLSHEM
jgi:hypothetical protein